MLAVPVQAPCQPWKAEPLAGFAVKVTVLLAAKPKEQVCPQSIPAGELVIFPVPEPVLLTVRVVLSREKLAVAVCAAPKVSAQVLVVPPQAPVQPSKTDPAVGAAVSVMAVFGAKLAVHAVPQSMPPGALVMVPVPVPALLTVSATGIKVKLAPTVCACAIVTWQVGAVPEQAPVQPSKVELAAAATDKVTLLPWLKLAVQVVPQSIPMGALLIVPVPVPVLVTVKSTWTALKLAVAVLAAFMVKVQVLAVPVQAPDQPVKFDPAVADAVRVTLAFRLKLAEQVAPQLIPAGELLTVPVPVPALVTVNSRTGTKLAVTVLVTFVVTEQVVAVPVQAPDQPLNLEPDAAVAVKVTLAVLAKLNLQVAPQLMPAGELVTVPVPVPVLVTVNLAAWALEANKATRSKKTAFVVVFISAAPYCGNTRFCRRESASYTLVWLRESWPLGSVTSSWVRLPIASSV